MAVKEAENGYTKLKETLNMSEGSTVMRYILTNQRFEHEFTLGQHCKILRRGSGKYAVVDSENNVIIFRPNDGAKLTISTTEHGFQV